MSAHPVVLSYGMGADSTALLLRWIHEPDTRSCDLTELLVVTAMTGDEWSVTGRLVAVHVLPLLRRHGIRYAKVARASARQEHGITVLNDSRDPGAVYLAGDYRLSDELAAAGTMPQVAGSRKCSAKAKGWVLDQFLAIATAGQPYRHAIGFEAGEAARARRDATYNTSARTGWYPLIEWGWDRAACERYIQARTGATWPKSACTYCPFALCTASGRARVLDAYAAEPQAGVQALVLEHIAVSLNPRQGLAAGQRLAVLLRASGRHAAVISAFELKLDTMPWHVYEVRRVILPRAADRSKAGTSARSLRALDSGNRQEMLASLRQHAAAHLTPVQSFDGIDRAWLRYRGAGFPAAEHFYVAAPAGPHDKHRPGFDQAWDAAIASASPELFRESAASY